MCKFFSNFQSNDSQCYITRYLVHHSEFENLYKSKSVIYIFNKRLNNFRLSRARMTIENSFGRLKGRWRILRTACEANIKRYTDYVLTCCILHNICERNNELYLNIWDYTAEHEQDQPRIEITHRFFYARIFIFLYILCSKKHTLRQMCHYLQFPYKKLSAFLSVWLRKTLFLVLSLFRFMFLVYRRTRNKRLLWLFHHTEIS